MGRVRCFCRHGASGAKFVGDCTHHCAGPRGVGEGKGGAFGAGVAVSADGRTAMVGAPEANVGDGAVWVFVRNGQSWKQQGAKLVVDCKHHCGGPRGQGENQKTFQFGQTIALSANGNTGLIGASGGVGAAWVFTRSHGGWSQQAKLVGNCVPTSAKVCTGPNGTGENYKGVNTGEFGSAAGQRHDSQAADEPPDPQSPGTRKRHACSPRTRNRGAPRNADRLSDRPQRRDAAHGRGSCGDPLRRSRSAIRRMPRSSVNSSAPDAKAIASDGASGGRSD